MAGFPIGSGKGQFSNQLAFILFNKAGVGATPGVDFGQAGKPAQLTRLWTWPATEYHTERWACDTGRR
jgi:hypothetical protein